MKKNIIALAIASALAAPAAFAAPTVYGLASASIDSVTDQGMSVQDGASRLGVKGSEDLGNGLTAVYKMEFAVTATDNAAISSRNKYVGLAGGFGTVLLGRHDTPLKMIQSTDLFNDSAADNKKIGGGLGLAAASGEVRVDSAIAYVSPSFSGVKIIAAGVSNLAAGDKNALTNVISLAATYGSAKEGVYLAAAMNSFSKDVTVVAASETRITAQYAKNALVANVLYTSADKVGVEGSNIQIGAGYTMGKMTPKVKYSMVDFKSTAVDDGSTIALGLDYALGKNTTTTVEYVAEDKNVSGTGKEQNTISLGLAHKF